MKIYLSGKFTGEDYPEAYQKFKLYEVKLSKLGHDVVNPLNHISEHARWENAMKQSLMLMMDCDTIFMLPDWAKSPGARMEFELAAKLSFRIFMNCDMDHIEKLSNLQKQQS